MTFRSLVAAVLGLVAVDVAQAQPVPPARPTYSSYSSIIRPGGGGTSYGFGFNQQDNSALVQNALLAQQLGQTAQQLNGIQTFLTTGVNPNVGVTGHTTVRNSLGHWYPSARNGGGGGGGFGGGISANRPLLGGGVRNSGAMTGGLGGFGMPAATNPQSGTGGTGGAKGTAPIPQSK